MKNLAIAFFSLLSLSFTTLCFAQPENPWTVGGFLGQTAFRLGASNHITPGTGGREADFNADKAAAYSALFLASYSVLDNLQVELQLMSNFSGDTIFNRMNVLSIPNDVNSPMTKAGTSLKVSTSAVGTYVVYKIGNEAFAKFRLGIAMSSAKYKGSQASESLSDVGISLGLSAGHTLGPGAIEFMYMYYPDIKASSRTEQKLSTAESKITLDSRQHLSFFSVGYIYSF